MPFLAPIGAVLGGILGSIGGGSALAGGAALAGTAATIGSTVAGLTQKQPKLPQQMTPPISTLPNAGEQAVANARATQLKGLSYRSTILSNAANQQGGGLKTQLGQ